ncbi:hypothetical protein I4U23_004804 [Adineta vaga]|nr:hypothetical protein I4U23_004804 [Adineta vaga]
MVQKPIVSYADADGNLHDTYSFDLQIMNPDTNGDWTDFDEEYLYQQNPYYNQPLITLNVLPTRTGRFRNSTISAQKIQASAPVTID